MSPLARCLSSGNTIRLVSFAHLALGMSLSDSGRPCGRLALVALRQGWQVDALPWVAGARGEGGLDSAGIWKAADVSLAISTQ
jgi:hypothetical protein